MATIDVSELMEDPDFIDDIQIIARTQTVDQYGKGQTEEVAPRDAIGVVQPATSGKVLERLPEGIRISDVITIWTKEKLKTDENDAYSDLVVWNGERYTVKNAMPYGNWGDGYIQADCVREKPSL